ncbi:transposase [Streptomyces roseus]|uniref:transposase n=1 Tax=Streptomyces roseus TaxID=66430 RepID=UPI0037FFCD09
MGLGINWVLPSPCPRRITTFRRHPHSLTGRQSDQLDRILDARPDLADARDLAHESSAISRERRGHERTHWMTRALRQGPPSPVQGFAFFLPNDWDAVVNGFTPPWSSDVVEGQVTRIIKLIKRRSCDRTAIGSSARR